MDGIVWNLSVVRFLAKFSRVFQLRSAAEHMLLMGIKLILTYDEKTVGKGYPADEEDHDEVFDVDENPLDDVNQRCDWTH